MRPGVAATFHQRVGPSTPMKSIQLETEGLKVLGTAYEGEKQTVISGSSVAIVLARERLQVCPDGRNPAGCANHAGGLVYTGKWSPERLTTMLGFFPRRRLPRSRESSTRQCERQPRRSSNFQRREWTRTRGTR